MTALLQNPDVGEVGEETPSAAALSLAACGMTSTASSGAPQLMFVHSAEDLKVDPAA
jgi:hypothetical protein